MELLTLIISGVIFLLLSFLAGRAIVLGKGKLGEAKVSHIVGRLPKEDYVVLDDLMLTNKYGSTTQIDHVVVSRYGIFVIETKNYKGLDLRPREC